MRFLFCWLGCCKAFVDHANHEETLEVEIEEK